MVRQNRRTLSWTYLIKKHKSWFENIERGIRYTIISTCYCCLPEASKSIKFIWAIVYMCYFWTIISTLLPHKYIQKSQNCQENQLKIIDIMNSGNLVNFKNKKCWWTSKLFLQACFFKFRSYLEPSTNFLKAEVEISMNFYNNDYKFIIPLTMLSLRQRSSMLLAVSRGI